MESLTQSREQLDAKALLGQHLNCNVGRDIAQVLADQPAQTSSKKTDILTIRRTLPSEISTILQLHLRSRLKVTHCHWHQMVFSATCPPVLPPKRDRASRSWFDAPSVASSQRRCNFMERLPLSSLRLRYITCAWLMLLNTKRPLMVYVCPGRGYSPMLTQTCPVVSMRRSSRLNNGRYLDYNPCYSASIGDRRVRALCRVQGSR